LNFRFPIAKAQKKDYNFTEGSCCEVLEIRSVSIAHVWRKAQKLGLGFLCILKRNLFGELNFWLGEAGKFFARVFTASAAVESARFLFGADCSARGEEAQCT